MTTTSVYVQLPLFPTGKVCTMCAQTKALEQFRLHRGSRDGYSSACKACLNAQQNARNREVPERRRRYSQQAKERYATNPTPEDKVCRGCRVRKPAAAFSRSHYSADRLRARCKECEARDARRYGADHRTERAAYRRAWYAKNRPWAQARARAYAATHPDAVRAWARRSYQRHREERLAREKEAHARNPERKRAKDRRYYQANKDKHAAYSRAYYVEHKEETLRKMAAWRAAHPDNVRAAQQTYRRKHLLAYAGYTRLRAARRRSAEGSHTAADVQRIYAEQAGLCYYCASDLNGTYHVDHKQPVSKGGSEWPTNLCCACERCNTRKGAKTEQQFWALLARGARS